MAHEDAPSLADLAGMEGGLTHAEAMAGRARREAGYVAEYGWYAHMVMGDPDSPTCYNAHTHHLREGYGHPDFQIVLPLPPRVAHCLLTDLAALVKGGRAFAAGSVVGGIIPDFDLGLAHATESGRDVLRVILPDPEGRTARGEIGFGFEVQYEGTT